MNKEVIKVMNKKEPSERVKAFKKWWEKNGYKVLRVVLFPLWAYALITEAIEKYLNSRNEWSEARADEILSYYIPREADWNPEKKTFYFFDNGYGWLYGGAKKYLKLKDRRFWRLYGYKVKHYFVDEFQLEGFTKEVIDSDNFTEVVFKMIETEEE